MKSSKSHYSKFGIGRNSIENWNSMEKWNSMENWNSIENWNSTEKI